MTIYSTDSFLGGKVLLLQDKNGLRATSDSVLLSALLSPQSGDSILDVGVGNGIIPLCLNARISGLKLTGIDIQDELIAQAHQNAIQNQCSLDLIQMDITKRPSPIHGKQFHHVITNPPFYDEPKARQNHQTAVAYQQQCSLSEWLLFCLRHIRAKGTLNLIHRPEFLPEILSVLSGKIGAIEIIPILSKENEHAKRILIRAKMNSRQPLRLCPPLIMHTNLGKRTKTAEKILRQGLSIDQVSSDFL